MVADLTPMRSASLIAAATAGAGEITLDWADNGEGDLAGYKDQLTAGVLYAVLIAPGRG
mgnify:CR=1 FL=1